MLPKTYTFHQYQPNHAISVLVLVANINIFMHNIWQSIWLSYISLTPVLISHTLLLTVIIAIISFPVAAGFTYIPYANLARALQILYVNVHHSRPKVSSWSFSHNFSRIKDQASSSRYYNSNDPSHFVRDYHHRVKFEDERQHQGNN